jgi:MoaA/NifB/PqqE/SkfB family radical SAM enzyme
MLLKMRSPCEMHCHFCDRGNGGPTEDGRKAFAQLRVDYPELVREARKQGLDWLTIGGDEPLTHPQVPEIVSTAQSEGFERIVIYTSGLALASPGVADDLAERGVTFFELPIYGVTADVHDAITGLPGSHGRLWEALEILQDRKIPFGLHCVVLRSNLHEVPALHRLISDLFRIELRVDQAFSRGGGVADYMRYAPSFSEIRAVTRGTGIRLDRFPVCVARDAVATFEPKPFVPFWGLDGFEQHSHLPACSPCRWKDRCPGPSRMYAQAYGDDGLNPEPDSIG